MSKRYELDPDYRKNPDTSKPFCCRCQKPITGKYKNVTVVDDWFFIDGGVELMGLNCYKKQTKHK